MSDTIQIKLLLRLNEIDPNNKNKVKFVNAAIEIFNQYLDEKIAELEDNNG
jgi:hypothetical protein